MEIVHQSMKLINHFHLFVLCLIFVFAFIIFFHSDSAITQDLGRHLILGGIIAEKRSIPSTNLFSYTHPDFPFINHHWGSEVIFYLFHQFAGINGLIIIKTGVLLVALGLPIFFSLRKADFTFLSLISILSLEIFRERTEIRPEIFAVLFFSLFLVILYQEKIKPSTTILTLPLIELFWVNSHISFILGPLFYFIFLLDRIFVKKFFIKKEYIFIGLSLIGVTFLNPAGWHGAIYPLIVFNNHGYSTVELQSPLFLEGITDNPTIFYFKIATILLLLITPFLIVKKYYFEALVALLTNSLSFWAIRNFNFFALSLIMPLSLGLTIVKDAIFSIVSISKKNILLVKRITLGVMLVFLFLEIHQLISNIYYFRRYSDVRTGLGLVKGIRGAVNFFINNNLKGPIFNNYDIGSYLIYRLYPPVTIFIDGRPEAYPVSFFQKIYIPMQEDEEIWREAERDYQFRTIILAHTDATPWGRSFIKRISKDQNWRIVFFDDYGVVLVRKEFIKESTVSLNTKDKLRAMGVTYLQKTKEPDGFMRLANFFDLIELSDLAEIAKLKGRGLPSL